MSSLGRLPLNMRCGLPIRGFSTGLPKGASAKEHRTRKQLYKKARDQQWRMEKSMNPFMRNVGMARALNKLGVDADDPVLADTELGGKIEDNLETWRDESRAVRKQFKADEESQKIIAKRKMVRKRMFGPEPSSPALLTWMEKEMIRYLHKKDPVQWDHQRLAESFPATSGIIHKVLRSKNQSEKESIDRYNKTVVQNWKMLSRGQLELDARYEDHLKKWAGRDNLKLSQGERQLAEQEIKVEVQDRAKYALPKPAVPGEFASIIVSYNRKLAEKEGPQNEVGTQDCFDMESLFEDNTLPGSPLFSEVSEYDETALLSTSIDLRKEPSMDIERFRGKYLTNKTKEREKEYQKENNSFRSKYMDWVQKQEEKSKYVTKDVTKVNSENLNEVNQRHMKAELEKKKAVVEVQESDSGQIFVFNPESGYKFPHITSHTPDVIKIPKNLQKKYNLFQLGDCIYDEEGEFVYRVPGLM